MTDRLTLLACLVAVSATCEATAADLVFGPFKSSIFAGVETRARVRIVSNSKATGTLHWSHSVEQRTLARGRVEVRNGIGEIVLNPPPLRDGVVVKTMLSAEFVSADGSSGETLDQPVWLFPVNPIEGQTEWARQLDVELLDPEGDTEHALSSIEFPYRKVRTPGADSDGILLIGEGVSLTRSRGLAASALQAAAAGRRVVMLAPVEGSLPLPIADDDVPAASVGELRFGRTGIITELDKRLDTTGWPAGGLLIESRRGRIEAAISDESQAWPWLEIRFPQTQGAFVMCGFKVVDLWDRGPTPRYLLLRVFESLERKKQDAAGERL